MQLISMQLAWVGGCYLDLKVYEILNHIQYIVLRGLIIEK